MVHMLAAFAEQPKAGYFLADGTPVPSVNKQNDQHGSESAFAQERTADAALGALSPLGAVAGAVVQLVGATAIELPRASSANHRRL
jgi:hypothetical protein